MCIQPLGRFGQRPELYQSGDWCSSGTLHPGQVLRGRLPLISPVFFDVPTFVTRCLNVQDNIMEQIEG
jgi:hypothetical protein